jgi:hypothetical protein
MSRGADVTSSDTAWPANDLNQAMLTNPALAVPVPGAVRAPRLTSFLQGRRIAFAVAVLNIMNAIMGAGILALPYWMAQNGVVLYGVLQLVVMLGVDLSLQMLVGSSKAQHVFTYDGLGKAAFGRPGKYIVCLTIVIQNLGAIISYLIVLGDLGCKTLRPRALILLYAAGLGPSRAAHGGEKCKTLRPRALILLYAAGLGLAALTVARNSGTLFYPIRVGLAALPTVARKSVRNAKKDPAHASYPHLAVSLASYPALPLIRPDLVLNHGGAKAAASPYMQRWVLMLVPTVVFIFPLACLRSIGALGYASLASFAVMFLLSIMAVARFQSTSCDAITGDPFRAGTHPPCAEIALVRFGTHTVTALPTLCFSFVCHTAFLPVLSELREADSLARSTRHAGRSEAAAHVAIWCVRRGATPATPLLSGSRHLSLTLTHGWTPTQSALDTRRGANLP